MFNLFSHAQKGDYREAGFVHSAYGVSKLGFYKATVILAEQMKSDPRHILINCVRFNYTAFFGRKRSLRVLEKARRVLDVEAQESTYLTLRFRFQLFTSLFWSSA